MSSVLERLKSGILLSDGAMGTELQKRGMPVGVCPEEFNISHPEIIKSIYKDYYSAGSDIVTTNTFGANRLRLKFYEYENRITEFNRAAVQIANEVRPSGKFIAGSIGPLGELIEPLGTITEAETYEVFAEQAKILEEAGVDIIFIETMLALEEILIAVKAVKENTSLPVSAAMSFELGNAGLRTPWGVDIQSAVNALTEANADIIGANCGKGFDEMILIVNEMKPLTHKPILAQANAGLPEWIDGISVYKQTPDEIAPKVKKLLNAGVNILGGCCGTNPLHIKKMRELLDAFQLAKVY